MVIMAFVWHFIQANAITYHLDYQLVNYNYGISTHFSIIFFILLHMRILPSMESPGKPSHKSLVKTDDATLTTLLFACNEERHVLTSFRSKFTFLQICLQN